MGNGCYLFSFLLLFCTTYRTTYILVVKHGGHPSLATSQPGNQLQKYIYTTETESNYLGFRH